MGDELEIRRIAREEAEKAVAPLRGMRSADADRIQGRHASAKAPTNQYYWAWNSTTKKWEPRGLVVVRKDADQTFTQSSTTLQDVTKLLFAVGASETWIFELFISYISGTTPNIKFSLSSPSGATIRWGITRLIAGVTASDPVYEILTSGEKGILGTGASQGIHIMGTIVNSTTAGDLQLRGAQNTSDASDTIVHVNSWLKAYQI